MNVLFINSAAARCSIHESGEMVAGCLRDSGVYNFISATIDELDPVALENGRFAWRKGLGRPALPKVHVSVFNWHIVTMPIPDALIARLPGIKLAIVLEAAPEDPLALTPAKEFDGYIVLDPTLPAAGKVFAFPRPLNPIPFAKRTRPNARPRIGTFGLPTPGKGFELVVEAVNREFDEADIRINLPRGDYTSTTRVIHDEDYVDYLRRSAMAVAKPGIKVEVATDYLSANELVEWCDANDLNCFMYTREQPGLSATTDQAIISGRPLITISNPTFRHVTDYISPYPRQSLREAIQSSVPAVLRMQKAWSANAFRKQFEDLVARLSQPYRTKADCEGRKTEHSRPLVLIAEVGRPASNDILSYRARVAAALDRSGQYKARVANASSLSALISELLRQRPELLFLCETDGMSREWANAIRAGVPSVRVVEGARQADGAGEKGVFCLQPIIPFHTTFVGLSPEPAILLVGFSADRTSLLRTLGIIARDDPAARVIVLAEAAEVEPLHAFLDTVSVRSRITKKPQVPGSAEVRNPYLRANSLAELLSWDDVNFVRCAYVTVLGRQPDPEGEAYYTSRIRGGRAKMEVLWQLRRSPEGPKHDPGITGFDRALKRASWMRKPIIGRLVQALPGAGGRDPNDGHNRQLLEEVEALRSQIAVMRNAGLLGLRIDVTTLPTKGREVIELMAAHRAIVVQDDSRAPEEIRDLLSLAYVTERQILISADRPVWPFSDRTPKLGVASLPEGDRLGSARRVGTVLDYGEWAFAAKFHDYVCDGQPDAASADLVARTALQDLALAGLFDLPPAAFVRAASVYVLGEVLPTFDEEEALLLSGASRGSIVGRLTKRLKCSKIACPSSGEGHDRAIRLFQAALVGLLDLDDREYVALLHRVILERDPDPDGFSTFVKRLGTDGSRASVMAEILRSKERSLVTGRGPALTRFPPLLELHPTLPQAIAWMEGLVSAPLSGFVKELERVTSNSGVAISEFAGADDVSRVEVILSLAAESRAVAGADETASARARLWNAWSSVISSNHLGVVHALQPLPDVTTATTDGDSPSPPSSLGFLSRWFGQWDEARAAVNIFGEEPPSRLISGIYPNASAPETVYLLVGDEACSTAMARILESHWPSSLLRLTPVEWNSATRRLEIRSRSIEAKRPVEDPESGCLLIAGPLPEAEPLGLVGAISEARTHEWSVVALAEVSPTAVTLQDPDNLPVTRMGLYWQSLILVDRVVATSRLAEQQLRKFLATELAYSDPALITTIPCMPGAGAQRSVQEAAFVHRFADAVTTLVRGPQEFLGSVFYHRGAAASVQAASLPQVLRNLGVSVLEMSEVSSVRPFPSNKGPAWIIADSETGVSKLKKLRDAAAKLSAKTIYLGPIPITARGLVEELMHWDVVASSRLEDFENLTEFLKTTTLRVTDAECRFVYLDHPCERVPESISPERTANKDKFQAGIVLHATHSADRTQLANELGRSSSQSGSETSSPIAWSDLSAPISRGSRVELDAIIDRASQMDLLIVAGPVGYVLDVIDRTTLRGTPCLVDSALSLPPLPGVFQAPFEEIKDFRAFVMANIDFFRTDLKKAAAMRHRSNQEDRTGELIKLMASQGAPSVFTEEGKPLPEVAHHPKQPLLSLCISTYNRGGWTAMNLEHIFRQIRGRDLPIEVLLVDNYSSDGTPEVASRFASEKNFRYVRNAMNVGMLGNLAVTAQHSRGKFVWIIGDDDFTRDGVIERVCELLQREDDYDLVCFNYGYVSYKDPTEVANGAAITCEFNLLEPAGPDRVGLAGELASLSENFYTAIYSHVYRRRHAIPAYCQNTAGRPFSSLLTCVPTSAYTLSQMAFSKAYWFGEPSLVINSNVSWQQYGSLFDLEQLPRVWDLAERAGADPLEVDRRRSNRLWLVEQMWREMYGNDAAGNQAYFDPERVLMRLKHLDAITTYVPALKSIYEEAHRRGEPAARAPVDGIFAAWVSKPDASGGKREAS